MFPAVLFTIRQTVEFEGEACVSKELALKAKIPNGLFPPAIVTMAIERSGSAAAAPELLTPDTFIERNLK